MSGAPATGRVLARRSTSLAPRIVILGGGFAGVTTAIELAKHCAGVLPVHITLVSERNFFLFTPMLAEAATGAVEARHVLYPIRPLCDSWGVEFGEMMVEAIDLERRRLVARHRRSPVRQHVQFDRLVLALGARPNVALAPGVAEHALTFKGVGDAVRIRNHVIDLFEAAALTDDPWRRRRLLPCVIWTAGNRVNSVVTELPSPKARDGRLKVNAFFEVEGASGVYALGDNAAQIDPHTGELYPATAQVALRQGRALAGQLAAELGGRERRPFAFRLLGGMGPLSRRAAGADPPGLQLTRVPAWVLWKTVYMPKLPTLASRFRVVLDWTVELFFERDVSELAVDEERAA